MSNWNVLDYLVFFIFFLNTILGIARGATKEIISMMCLTVAMIVLIRFTVPLAGFMDSSPLVQNVIDSVIVQNFMASIGADPLTVYSLRQITFSLAVLICFVGTFSAGEAVLAFTGIVEVYPFPIAFLNRKLGAALGFIRGYVIAIVFLLIVQHLYIARPITDSYFLNLFHNTVVKLNHYITEQNTAGYKAIMQDSNLYNENDMLNKVTN
jgi:uncharacterized membrane protein required for colicin V production